MEQETRDIFSYITSEEAAYNTLPITVIENYEWNMAQHIMTTVLYKNSQYLTGKNDDKPFKNITRPILNVQYRAEGFTLEDFDFFVDDSENFHKSFLVTKYHDEWALKHRIDKFLKELVVSYVDFGGALLKKGKDAAPEVVALQSIAFCDQTNILSGPLGIQHFYAPDELLDMKSAHWGDTKFGATATLEEVLLLSKNYKIEKVTDGKQSKTPGRYVKVYEVHGMFPRSWLLKDTETPTEEDETTYTRQLHIVTFLKKQDGTKNGITLFKGPEKESIFKLLLRDPIYGRALGLGGAEELFEPQVWVNYDIQRAKGLRDAAAKILYQTDDTAFANRNKTTDLENGEILIHATNMPLAQINTEPVNIAVFENSIKDWEAHAQQMGAANDAIMGQQPTSGTPFKLQELVTQEGHSLHESRKQDIADFVALEVYPDWILPQFAKDITEDHEFLTDLDLDDLQTIAENVAVIQTNAMKKEAILNGQPLDKAKVDAYHTQARDQFMKGGNKRFVTILKGELEDLPISVKIDIAGKEKDLSGQTDKLTNIFRQLMANPGILDDPRMAKIFNQILESSGLSPIDFYQKPAPQQNNAPGPKVAESINFADLPPDGQVQMAQQAGIKIAPPAAPAATPPAMAQPTP